MLQILLILGICVLFLLFSDEGLCMFRRITGIPCPGCGMTRAVTAALHGDFRLAFACHPLWILLPVFGYLLVTSVMPDLFPWTKKPSCQKAENILSILLLILVIGVYLLRLLGGWDGIHVSI